jgi:hypothetical protein
MKIEHNDHGLTASHAVFLASALASETGFFVRSYVLPDELPSLPAAAYGPTEGDAPVGESEVHYTARGPRGNLSRMVARPTRPARHVVAIGDASAGVLYTAYGTLTGTIAPREPGDIDSSKEPEAHAEATAWWAQHALASLP